MIDAWNRFVRWTSATEVGTPLAMMRIALGLCTLWILVDMLSRGLVDVLWIDREYGGFRDLPRGNWLVAGLGGPRPDVVHGLVAYTLVVATMLTLGIGGRGMALLTLFGIGALTDINSQAGGSYDELLENGLWIAFLGPSTATLSLDSRWRTGSFFNATPVWAGARYLALLQLVIMYASTGWQKLSIHWIPGGGFSALYYIFQQPTWQRFDMTWVAWFYPLTQIGTGVSWFWEVFSPLWLLAVWYRATRTRKGWVRAWFNAVDVRTIYAWVGLTFHILLWILMDVGPFSPISLAYYFVVIDPEEYASVWRRITARFRPTPP